MERGLLSIGECLDVVNNQFSPKMIAWWERDFLQAMIITHHLMLGLGDRGLKQISINGFGDNAMYADIEMEAGIIAIMRHSLKDDVRFLTEEHGFIDKPNAGYLCVIDGLDGSNNYKADRLNGRYGTMAALYYGQNPIYAHYYISAIMNHVESVLYFAIQFHGTWKLNLVTGQLVRIATKQELITCDQLNKVNFDNYFDINKKFIKTLPQSGIEFIEPGASAANYMDLLDQQTQLVVECSRKSNLEIIVSYGLTREAGGVVVDQNGDSIGSQFVLDYLQNGEQQLIISCANASLAQDLKNKYLSKL